MNTEAAGPLAAAVLAGGLSTRMGRDKALLGLGGTRLVDRQLELLRALGPAELALSGRRGVDYAAGAVAIVFDRIAERGPLGGLDAVLAATTAPHVLVLAVDMPAMTASFLARLAAARTAGAGVVPLGRSGWEPLAAVYPRWIAGLVGERLASGRLSMRGLVEEAARTGLVRALDVGPAEERALANWNEGDTPPS